MSNWDSLWYLITFAMRDTNPAGFLFCFVLLVEWTSSSIDISRILELSVTGIAFIRCCHGRIGHEWYFSLDAWVQTRIQTDRWYRCTYPNSNSNSIEFHRLEWFTTLYYTILYVMGTVAVMKSRLVGSMVLSSLLLSSDTLACSLPDQSESLHCHVID